jgi:subtilisin family serine protease
MKKKNPLRCFLFMALFVPLALSARENFFYSRDIKINVSIVPDMIVVVKKSGYSTDALTKWIKTKTLPARVVTQIKEYDKMRTVISTKGATLDSIVSAIKENSSLHVVSPVYRTDDGEELIPTEEIIIQFKKEILGNRITTILRERKLNVVRTKKGVANYYVLKIPAGGDPLEIANRLSESGVAEWAQPNFIPKLVKPQTLPNDTHFGKQFQMHNTGQVINNGKHGVADADVDAPEAWKYAKGTGITVAVIDEGVDTANPDLPSARRVAGYDYADNDANAAPAHNSAHGTACAGIIGATQNNNVGVSGIAPACSIMPIKIWKDNGDNCTNADIADAIDFAWQNGAQVISNSWGYNTSQHYKYPVVTDAIRRALVQGRDSLGAIVVFAAGNTANHPTSNGHVNFPANYDSVICVGASSRSDSQSLYSPTDDEVFVVAPSQRAYRCQDTSEAGDVWTTDIAGDSGYNPWHEADACMPLVGTEIPLGDRAYTGLMGGTSAACPLVAGITALLLQVNPQLRWTEVKSILRATAEKIDASHVTYDNTGFNKSYGYGRVNAHRAIVPTATISVNPKQVAVGTPFSVTVTGSAPFGLAAVWWFGQNTGIVDIDKAHYQTAPGSVKVYTYSWPATINKKGTFTLGANVRDVRYPNPGDGFPHQASEGSGIPVTTIKVVPAEGAFAGGIMALLFMAGAFGLHRRSSSRGIARRSAK